MNAEGQAAQAMPAHRWLWRALPNRAVDGDTIDVTVDLGFHMRRDERIRLLGVDTPEIVGADRAAGLAARNFVQEWLRSIDYEIKKRILWENHELIRWPLLMETFPPRERDSFGRWLAVIWRRDTGECLNSALIAAGHGQSVT